jgi:hypothetical protein
MWTLFCNVCIDFLNSQIWKEFMLEFNGKPSSVAHSQLIFLSKTWFFGVYLNFQRQTSFKNQYLPHPESKSYQINSIKSCSSRSFQQTKGTSQFLWSFQLQFNLISVKKLFNIQELLHSKFKQHGTMLMHASSSRTFQRDREHDLKHPSSVNLISSKQNKQTTLLHR